MWNSTFDNTLKEEVRKLNFNDLKDVDDIFEKKEIKLNIDCILEDANYFKLKQAKTRAQLIINHFNNYETFRNCELLKVNNLVIEDVDESNDGDMEYIFAAKPNEEDLIDALYDYAFWFLITQQTEIHGRWKNIRESMKTDVIMCCMCDSELTLNESTCSVCYEPIISTIQELMVKHSLNEKRTFSSTETEDHSVRGSKYHGEMDLDTHGKENEYNIRCYSDMSDVESRSHYDSMDMNSATLDSNIQSTDCVGICIDGYGTDNESLKTIHNEAGGQNQTQEFHCCRGRLGHENTRDGLIEDCSAGSSVLINTDGFSRESIQSFSKPPRDNKYCNVSVSNLHREELISGDNDEPQTSLISESVPSKHVGSHVDSDCKWPCESCGLLNDLSFVSCEACSVPKVAMWTCPYCNVDNKISNTKCVGCDHEMEGAVQRKFCIKCRDNEVVAEDEICEECLRNKWVCWRTICHGINFGTTQYCNYCGIDRAADITPGHPIKMLKDDEIHFIWICSQCNNTNNDNNQDRCGNCQGPRYLTGSLTTNLSDDVCDDFVSYQIIDGSHNSERQSIPPPRNQLYPSLSLWTCHRCQMDNVISSSLCIACESSRNCKQCKVNESIFDNLCAVCITHRWRCWYGLCKNTNFDSNAIYCEKCGLTRQPPNVSGEAIWQKIYDRNQLVWMCDICQKINVNYDNVCSNHHCRAERNTKFVWCKRCGWGTPSRTIDIIWSRKCKHCNFCL